MVFKGLEKYLNRKLFWLKDDEGTRKKVKEILEAFLLSKKYPQANIIYQPGDKQVVIEAQTKVFSTELSYHLDEINRVLKDNKISIDRIIIR